MKPCCIPFFRARGGPIIIWSQISTTRSCAEVRQCNNHAMFWQNMKYITSQDTTKPPPSPLQSRRPQERRRQTTPLRHRLSLQPNRQVTAAAVLSLPVFSCKPPSTPTNSPTASAVPDQLMLGLPTAVVHPRIGLALAAEPVVGVASLVRF